MNIHEHQAKDLLKEFEAPASNGVVVFDAKEVEKKLKALLQIN